MEVRMIKNRSSILRIIILIIIHIIILLWQFLILTKKQKTKTKTKTTQTLYYNHDSIQSFPLFLISSFTILFRARTTPFTVASLPLEHDWNFLTSRPFPLWHYVSFLFFLNQIFTWCTHLHHTCFSLLYTPQLQSLFLLSNSLIKLKHFKFIVLYEQRQ